MYNAREREPEMTMRDFPFQGLRFLSIIWSFCPEDNLEIGGMTKHTFPAVLYKWFGITFLMTYFKRHLLWDNGTLYQLRTSGALTIRGFGHPSIGPSAHPSFRRSRSSWKLWKRAFWMLCWFMCVKERGVVICNHMLIVKIMMLVNDATADFNDEDYDNAMTMMMISWWWRWWWWWWWWR